MKQAAIFGFVAALFLSGMMARLWAQNPATEVLRIRDEVYAQRFIANEALMGLAVLQMELANESGDSALIGWAHLTQAWAWRNQDDISRQLEHFFAAYDIGHAVNDQELVAESAYEIGNTYMLFTLGKGGTQGKKYLEEAQGIFAELNDTLGICKSLIDLGLLLANKKEIDIALDNYAKAEIMARQIGDNFSLGRISNNRSDIFQRNTWINYDSVIYHAKQALERDFDHPRTRAVGLLNLGIGEVGKGMREEGLGHLLEGIEQAEIIRPSNMHGAGCRALYQFFLEEKNYEKALEYHECYTQKSAYFRTESEISQYELAARARQKELELANLEIEVRESRLFNQRILIGGFLIGILGLLLWLLQSGRKSRLIRKQNKRLEEQNQQVNQMLGEIHHRVKNNLQMIVGLLDLQHASIRDPKLGGTLNDARNRVNSIALVHQKLYQGHGDRVNVGFRNYIRELCEHLLYVYTMNDKVILDLAVEDVELSFNRAVTLGLLVNELVTNSLKHAFSGPGDARLRIVILRKNGGLLVRVSDNGPGFSQNFEEQKSASFGVDMIESFAADLGGTPRFFNENGAVVEIELKKIDE